MTYRCEKCGFVFTEEPTKPNLLKHFPEVAPLKDYECPSYKLGEVIPCRGKMVKE